MMDELSKKIRREILTEAYKQKHGHIASCFSCVEILLAIKEVMKEGDHFILSKGHALLAEKAVFGKEISCYKTGSLGHGLGVACGIALGDPDQNVYVVVGDGELQEGSCWEALQYMEEYLINNIFVIIDHNLFQASKSLKDTLVEDILSDSYFTEIDGHNIEELKKWLVERLSGPSIIIADTVKGKGSITISSNPIEWHTRIPMNEQEYNMILKEIDNG